MNIPDKKTDLKDNRNARSFLKTRIQTESAGFFNGLLSSINRFSRATCEIIPCKIDGVIFSRTMLEFLN